jgi:hypothetical protein
LNTVRDFVALSYNDGVINRFCFKAAEDFNCLFFFAVGEQPTLGILSGETIINEKIGVRAYRGDSGSQGVVPHRMKRKKN